MISGKLHMHAIAWSPIRHGGETSGNTTMVREREFIDPRDNTPKRAPVVSGNSFRHMIRAHGAKFALEAMGAIEGAEWSKAERDLFASGGNLTSGGAKVDAEAVRKLERAFPILSVCGYAAGNHTAAGKIKVDWLHLLCQENAWRVYGRLREEVDNGTEMGEQIARALEVPAAQSLDEEFGTRHDSKDPTFNEMLSEPARKKLDTELSHKAKTKHADRGSSIQMKHDFGVVNAGTQWQGCVVYRGLNEMEMAALAGALHHACEEVTGDGRKIYRVGGRAAAGYGKIAVRWLGSLRKDIRPPEHIDADAIVQWGEEDDAMEAYIDHLREHKSDLKEGLEALL